MDSSAKMYTQLQLSERLSYLKSISPSGAMNLFYDLESAIDNYFNRDVEFENLIRKTLMRVISDAYNRGISVEYPERLPPMSTDFPCGYNNITEIFGSEIFDEIMTIDSAIFRAAFQSQTETSGNGGSVTLIYSNSYIRSWLNSITLTKDNEVAALEMLGEFCIACNEERGLALIFEELGQINQRWSKEQRNFARHCYIERGFDEIIKTFKLKVFEPHYISEIRN